MTKDKAITILNALWTYRDPNYTEKEIRIALDIAIKALERNYCETMTELLEIVSNIHCTRCDLNARCIFCEHEKLCDEMRKLHNKTHENNE